MNALSKIYSWALLVAFFSGFTVFHAQAELVGLWRFENNADDTTAYGNHGSITGVVSFVEGKSGLSASFQEIGSRVDVPDSDSLDITGAVTIAAWINATMVDGALQYFLTKGPPETGKTTGNQPGNYEFRLPKPLESDGSKPLQACWRNTDGITNSLPTARSVMTVSSNTWTHVAMVWSDATLVFYIDGTAYDSLIDPDFGMTNNSMLYIGNRSGNGDCPLIGEIDDLAIFNEALSPAAIQQIMTGDFSEYLDAEPELKEAEYQRDFSGETLPDNWLYLWNETGSISNETNFAALEPDVLISNRWQTAGGVDSQLELTSEGACPGSSVSNAYAVAGYQIQTAGRYFLNDTWVSLATSGGSGVELRVFINSETPLLIRNITSTNPVSFDTELGLLRSGDTVYVALGPDGDTSNDSCLWNFSIDRKPVWYSSGYRDPIEVPVYTERSLDELDIFNAGQPRPFSFRDDYLGGKTYDVFYNTVTQSYGHAPKMFSEELINSIRNQPYMADLAASNPEKMLLCHYNFQEIKIMSHDEFAEFFPGHWQYYPGSSLVSPVSATDTVITVESSANYIQNSNPGPTNNSVLALIPIDENGERLWAQTEYVAMVSKSGTQVTVERGLFRTSARDFPAGTHIAVLPHLYEGVDTSFRFNWSSECPLDAEGRNCGDVFVQMIASYFHSGQPLEHIHGILADVLFWAIGTPVSAANVNARNFDTDGDGLGDNGYNDKYVNCFGQGAYDMCRKLRLALGPNRIFSGDGNGSHWPRVPNFMNGMESEGLTHWDDPYAKQWSSNINRFRYWQEHPGFDHTLNYIVDKLPTLTDEQYDLYGLQLQRLAGAVAAILDIGVTARGTKGVTSERAYELYDHLKQGVVTRPGWLGEPDEWMRPATNTLNLFSGTASDWVSDTAAITQDESENAWHVQSSQDQFGSELEMIIISLPNQTVPAGDLFIRCRIKAAPLTWFPSNVYRYVYSAVDGREANPSTEDNPDGIASSDGYSECCFYYRDVSFAGGGDSGPVTISLGIEGMQDFWIRDFSVHSATDVLVRGFENGVVLANPSNQSYTFDLSELFPDRICWRITGNEWEDPETNSGEPVGDTVTLGDLEGLFLRSEPDTDHDGLSDRWEQQFAGSLTTLSGNGDSDGDGVSDADEHIAGTNPLDAESVFALQFSAETSALEWPAVQDHKYTVWWTDALGNEWTEIDTVNQFGSDAAYSLELNDTNDFSQGFFRMSTSPY